MTQINGSPILSYHLQIDDGMGREFVDLVGRNPYSLALNFVKSAHVITGRLYWVRYRALNEIGWSAYSPIGYILAAEEPFKPQPPVISIDGINSIIRWTLPNNLGAQITKAEITLIGQTDRIDNLNCNGSDPLVFFDRKCTIPLSLWNTMNGLVQGVHLAAKIRFEN